MKEPPWVSALARTDSAPSPRREGLHGGGEGTHVHLGPVGPAREGEVAVEVVAVRDLRERRQTPRARTNGWRGPPPQCAGAGEVDASGARATHVGGLDLARDHDEEAGRGRGGG